MPKEKMVVTPWEVKGKIDYDKLIKEFGTQRITTKLLERIRKHAGDHYMLRRKIFFSHRDMDWILDEYEKGNKFYLYTGRGPSGHTHLGHLVPWIFTKWLQDTFKTKLYFQMTDDEKFVFNPKLSLEDVSAFTRDNVLDIIAMGFDERKTWILSDIENADLLYKQALRVAKKLTFSTVKATFGFDNAANVGRIFFTSMQSVPAFLESLKQKKNVPCLIPHAIDQDAHFRVCRDVMPKLGFYKPAAIHSKFLPGLGELGKMSASDPSTTIFTTDKPETIKSKIMNAFTGGGGSLKEQREKGGKPDICTIYSYYYFLFEPDDEKLKQRHWQCRAGRIACGECKRELAKRIVAFLKEHQRKRKKAKNKINKFMMNNRCL